VSDELGVRIDTSSYDDKGRVTENAGAGGASRLQLSYATNNQTTVTSYASGVAVSSSYAFQRTGGLMRPTAISAPCSLCGTTSRSSV